MLFPLLASAQSAKPAEPESRVWASGYIQPQVEVRDDGDEVTSRTLFRRIFLRVDGVRGNWHAQLETDLGATASGTSTRLIVKNAYVQYTGWERRGLVLTAGNQKIPFSRSYFGSSSKRSFVERFFAGDRGFGSPGRAFSVRLDGWHRHRTLFWSGAVADTRQSPDAGEFRLDGIAEGSSTWQKGPIVAGRLELHPRGEMARDHGHFDGKPLRYSAGIAAYGWWNDRDVHRGSGSAVAAGRARAFEVSGGLRAAGVSLEAEFDHITGTTLDPEVTAGVYAGGEMTIDKVSVETGYMLIRNRLEALGGADALSVEAFDVPWRRLAGGLVLYVNGHQLKFALMHRESFNDRGIDGARTRATYLQTQFAF
jgi:hypothetical protein